MAGRRSVGLGAAAWACGALAATLVIGCSGELGSAGGCHQPNVSVAALGASGPIKVVAPAGCGRAGADGTVAAPFDGLAAAGAIATGDSVVLLPGIHEGDITLPAGAHLLGLAAAAPAAEPLPVAGEVVVRGAVRIEGGSASPSRVERLRVQGAAGVGIAAIGAAVQIKDAVVIGTTASGSQPGHGVEVTQGGSASIVGVAVLANAGVGVLARGAGPISIVEPIFTKPPRGTGDDKIGIVEPIFAPSAQILGNSGGGIAIVEPIFSPKGDVAAAALTVKGAQIRDNKGFGVALYGAEAAIAATAIHRTVAGAKGPWADGVMLLASKQGTPSSLQLDADSIVTGNARAGVAALARATLQIDADVSNNGYVGVWATKEGSVVTISAAATLWANHLCAVGVSGGADLQMKGGRVGKTQAIEVGKDAAKGMVGDGIGVFDGARATIVNVTFVDNSRAGVLVHAAATKQNGLPDVDVEGSTFVGGQYAVVVNGAPALSLGADNSYQGSKDPSGAQAGAAPRNERDASLPAQTAFCTGDAASCVPEP